MKRILFAMLLIAGLTACEEGTGKNELRGEWEDCSQYEITYLKRIQSINENLAAGLISVTNAYSMKRQAEADMEKAVKACEEKNKENGY